MTRKGILILFSLVIVLSVNGSIAVAADRSAEQNEQNMVFVCHEGKTLEVNRASAQKHAEQHSDALGMCDLVIEPDPCSVYATEAQCVEQGDSCVGNYGPSYCGQFFCTADNVFQSCSKPAPLL